jgi:hypothetical protein
MEEKMESILANVEEILAGTEELFAGDELDFVEVSVDDLPDYLPSMCCGNGSC